MSLPDNYVGLSPLYCGRAAPPSATPAWATSAALNQWIAIPGTSGTGNAAIDPWGAFALRDDADGIVQIAVLASGGHTDSNDNRVVSLDLITESPSWVQRVTPSAHPFFTVTDSNPETDYYSWEVTRHDVPKPGSSHLYDYVSWCKPLGRYMRIGAFGTWNAGGFSQCVDGIAPVGTTWIWDAPGTYPLYPATGSNSNVARGNPDDGIIWRPGHKWVPGQSSWTAQSNVAPVRFPNAYDTSRNAIFGMEYGNGQDGGSGLTVTAVQNFLAGAGSNRSITLTDSDGSMAQIVADQATYAAMDYDRLNDKFHFYYDYNGSLAPNARRHFVITPAGGTAWNIAAHPYNYGGAGAPDRAPASGAGINGRMKYSRTLKGFLLIPKTSSSVYFMRTT